MTKQENKTQAAELTIYTNHPIRKYEEGIIKKIDTKCNSHIITSTMFLDVCVIVL